MNIIVPCDGPQTRDAVIAVSLQKGPFYVRLGRAKVPTIDNKGEFILGKAQVLTKGSDITIIACGVMVSEALAAVNKLSEKNIKARLINMHTIRPLDKDEILKAAKETKAIIVCEEHTVIGGLASSVQEVISEEHPTKVVCLGVKNRFGQSGDPASLMKEYNLTSVDIEKAALKALS